MRRVVASLLLAVLLVPAAAPAKGRGDPRVQEVAKLIDGSDLQTVDRLMTDDQQFAGLAYEALDGRESRRSTGNNLIGAGLGLMVVGALIGAPTYAIPHYVDSLSSPLAEKVGIGIMGAVMGLGFVLLVPGIVVAAVPSGAENDLDRYYQDTVVTPVRPDTHLHVAPRPYAVSFVPSWTFAF